MDKLVNHSVVPYSVKGLFSVQEKHRDVFALEKLVTGAVVMMETMLEVQGEFLTP